MLELERKTQNLPERIGHFLASLHQLWCGRAQNGPSLLLSGFLPLVQATIVKPWQVQILHMVLHFVDVLVFQCSVIRNHPRKKACI